MRRFDKRVALVRQNRSYVVVRETHDLDCYPSKCRARQTDPVPEVGDRIVRCFACGDEPRGRCEVCYTWCNP